MQASVVDFRKNMTSIQKALSRNESVTVLSHGKPIGVLNPIPSKKPKKSIKEYPFFGMNKDATLSVTEQINVIRKSRHAI